MTCPTPLILLSLSLCLATACGVPEDGKLGNLSFTYGGARGTESLSKGFLPPGAKLDVHVHKLGQERAEAPTATIVAAGSVAPEAFEVEGFEGDRVTLKALAPGQGDLQVTAKVLPEDTEQEDTVAITVAKPQSATLTLDGFGTEDSAGPKVLAYSAFSATYTLSMDDGRKSIGYGYYPFASDALELLAEPSTATRVVFQAGGPVEKARVTSELTGNELLAVELVDPARVDGTALVTGTSLRAGEKDVLVFVLPTVNGQALSQPGSNISVTSLTPEVCTIGSPEMSPLKEFIHLEGILQAQPLKAGQCEFELSYLDGAGMTASTHKVSLEVVSP